MNSFNHYAFGSVGEWLFQSLAGIRPAKPGFKEIILKPSIGGNLKYAKGIYNTLYGKVVSQWQIKGDKFIWNIEIPPNVRAVAFVPGKNGQEIGSGRHRFELSNP
ncbi:MAG: hypothetical protein HY747_01450 [Elusimicrobia bacterium]|nr:hypothetical protein [Elusimicrobiota bacterium]